MTTLDLAVRPGTRMDIDDAESRSHVGISSRVWINFNVLTLSSGQPPTCRS